MEVLTQIATGAGLNASAVVYALAVNPKQPNIIFAGTRGVTTGITSYCSGATVDILNYGGGVFRSSNGGASWTQVDGGQACGYVYGLAIDPVKPNIVYVATHGKGVLKSTNGGTGFAYKNSGLSDLTTRSIVIDPENDNQLFVSTWHGGAVFTSTNGAAAWNTAHNGIIGFNVLNSRLTPVLTAIIAPYCMR